MSSLCHCGTATKTPHEVGNNGCVHFFTEAPEFAGFDPELDSMMWRVPGETGPITDFTLRQQRGYHQHENGQWSRWEGSVNSIEA